MYVYAVVGATILEVFLQREPAAMKRDVVPRNLVLGKQTDLESFFADAAAADQFSGIEQVHLARVHHIN